MSNVADPAEAPIHTGDPTFSERHRRILDAAERCFAKNGFHRCTMQDVAAAAGMSPGNLYRYFPSKDALVVGLTERDRAEVMADFFALSNVRDVGGSFRQSLRKHLIEEPRENAVLCMEIWAESTRNPVFAEISHTFERDVIAGIVGLVEIAKAEGRVDAAVDSRAFAILASTLANGLFVRRAILPNFDADREIETAVAVIEAAARGLFPLPPVVVDEPPAPAEAAAHPSSASVSNIEVIAR